MGVGGASTADGAQVVQWACNGSTDQHWIFQDTFNSIGGWPVYKIVNVNAHKCLGIGGGSISIGANAVIWPCDGSQNQLFY